MKENYEFLVEKQAMWAGMLMQVLEDNGIPCISQPVHGAAMTLRGGLQEALQIYVPGDLKPRAEELLEELFSAYEDEF